MKHMFGATTLLGVEEIRTTLVSVELELSR